MNLIIKILKKLMDMADCHKYNKDYGICAPEEWIHILAEGS